ncbi:MAG: hypothetical protein ACOYLO_03895 [Ferruginibacter sp.]
MKLFIQQGIRWPLGHLIFFILIASQVFISCKNQDRLNPLILTKQDSIDQQKFITRAFKSIAEIKHIIHSGDFVTRTGNDFTSQSLRTLNRRNETYSHCGIASIENDSLFIYHAMGGEWNPDEKLRRDPFESFAEPYSNKGIGIFNFLVTDSLKNNLLNVTRQFYQDGLMFDMDFDLQTDDRMYCAEFIYKTFLKASNNQLAFNKSRIGDFVFIGVDDIFLHPLCRTRIEIVYK